MNQTVLYRVYLVRQVLTEVLQRVPDPLPVARMRVVWALDYAIELLLSTLLPKLGVSDVSGWPLPRMLQELLQRTPSLASHHAPIRRLRSLRNRVQHDGVIPSVEDVRQVVVEAESFVRDTLREVLGKELEEISIAELVNDETARQCLFEAQEALQREDYRTAIAQSARAFDAGWREARRQQSRSHHSWGREVSERVVESIAEALQEAANDMEAKDLEEFAERFASANALSQSAEALYELAEPLELAYYGIDLRGYALFQQIVPHRAYWDSAYQQLSLFDFKLPEWSPSKSDALFTIDFASYALLQLQEWLRQRPQE